MSLFGPWRVQLISRAMNGMKGCAAWAVCSMWIAAGCGGQHQPEPASPEAEKPSSSVESEAQQTPSKQDATSERPEPALEALDERRDEPIETLAEAQALLEESDQRLAALFPPPSPATSQPGAAPADGQAEAGAARSAEPKSKKTEGDRCKTACRAFASLSRAADAICRLALEASESCQRAQRLVETRRALVSSCQCE